MILLFNRALLFLIIFIYACSIPQKKESEKIKHLYDAFKNPPNSSKPGAYWCWLNGDVTKASITKDLEQMKDKGMGRAEIWDVEAMNNADGMIKIGPQFLGEESVEFIHHALSEGKRLGIKIGLIASSGWNAGGSWVTPDWAAKALYCSEVKISGGKMYTGSLPFPKLPSNCPKNKTGMPVFYKEVAVIAIPTNSAKKINSFSELVVLTDLFDGNTLSWNVPEGDWTILRFICSNTGQHLIVPSPKSNGLFIDFFNPSATKKHLGYILSQLGITKKNAKESGLSYLEFDSMELDEATPWTDAMDSIFYAHHNYNINLYLPAFCGWKLPNGNEKFLYDFSKTVSNQLIFSHYTTGRDFLAEYGIGLVAEAGGPGPPIWNSCPVDALKALGNVSIPRGEFWMHHRNMFLVKEVASAAHIYGLKNIDAESFTTWRRWKDAPHALKPHVDRAFCEGLNMLTFHTFTNTRPEHGLPGRAYHAGADINPTATWWEQSKPFMDYLSRCSNMLKQGKFVADIAYYYGDKAPNFFPEFHDVPTKPKLDGMSFGYDFDIVNTDVLLNRMSTSEGKLTLPDGMNYQLLVIPNRKDIPEKVIQKIQKMAENRANILIQSPEIADKIHGKIQSGISIDDALHNLSVKKDFSADENKLDFIHRNFKGIDIYFIRNKTAKTINETINFRTNSKHIEFWNPITAQCYKITSTKHKQNTTEITLQLAAYSSGFVVFCNTTRQLPNLIRAQENGYFEIKTPWKLSFPEDWGAPKQIELNQLISWTEHSNAGIKYFSGTATYSNHFNISEEVLKSSKNLTLNLGEVRDVAEVFVNNKKVGTLWTKPFELDIKKFTLKGKNELKVRITNMRINRLVGDLKLPNEKRFCKTNQPIDKHEAIQKSGLIGPVSIQQTMN